MKKLLQSIITLFLLLFIEFFAFAVAARIACWAFGWTFVLRYVFGLYLICLLVGVLVFGKEN